MLWRCRDLQVIDMIINPASAAVFSDEDEELQERQQQECVNGKERQ
jgi:hypothetical protein